MFKPAATPSVANAKASEVKLTAAPIELTLDELKQVGGAGPRAGWSPAAEASTSPAGPRAGW